MTLENETNLEDLSADENEFGQEAGESLDDSIREAFAEHGTEIQDEAETETDGQLPGDQGSQPDKPTVDASEAARILANSKKKGKAGRRQTLEAKDLDLGQGKKEVTGAPAAPVKFDPPARFPVEKKEWFNKQPPEAQEEIVKGWNDIEARTTKVWQDLQRESAQVAAIKEVAQHYRTQWHQHGLTEAQAIAQLAATNERLVNPATRLTTFDRLARDLGITPQEWFDYQNGGQGGQTQQHQPAQQQNTAQQVLTRDHVLSILNEHSQTSQQQQLIYNAQAEVEAVKNAAGADGRYLYPELHRPEYISRVKPLVEDLRKTQPGISWSEATKRAVHTLRALDGNPSSPSPGTSPRLPSSELANIKAASVSVRGRGASIPSITKAKPGETIEESTRAVLAALTTAH